MPPGFNTCVYALVGRFVRMRLYGMVVKNFVFVSHGICTYLRRLLSNFSSFISNRQRP